MQIKKSTLNVIYVVAGLLLVWLIAGFISVGKADNISSESIIVEDFNIGSLYVADFKEAMQKEGVTLIDIRTEEEFNAGHIEGALQTDFYQTDVFRAYLEELPRDGEYLIYCNSGNRTGQTLYIMESMGFEYVHDLKGGIISWDGDVVK